MGQDLLITPASLDPSFGHISSMQSSVVTGDVRVRANLVVPRNVVFTTQFGSDSLTVNGMVGPETPDDRFNVVKEGFGTADFANVVTNGFTSKLGVTNIVNLTADSLMVNNGTTNINAPNLLRRGGGGPNAIIAGPTRIVGGTTALNVSGELTTSRLTSEGRVQIDGTMRIRPDGTANATSSVRLFFVGATGMFDLADNAMVVYDVDPSILTQVKGYIASGHHGGLSDGPGVNNSVAAANTTHAVGYADASQLSKIPDIFRTVDPTALLVRYTRYGDANSDGFVNLADFNRLAANFGMSDLDWTHGNFNFDNVVNLADFNLLAGNFGLSAGPDGPGLEDWAALAAVVPEATAVTGPLLLPLLAAVRQSRRRS